MTIRDELYRYLISTTPLSLQAEPFDSYDRLIDIMSGGIDNNIRINTMPPGPGTEVYSLNYRMTAEGLYYKAEVQWAPFVTDWLIHNIEPFQITHRSRFIALASNRLQIAEIDKRIAQTRENAYAFEKNPITERQSEELYAILMQATKKYMKLNYTWIQHYIHEHEQSSLGKGWKWERAYNLYREDWESLFGIYMNNIEMMTTHPGWSNSVMWNLGIRARSDSIDAIQRYYDWRIMDRSRIILFHPAMNMLTVFLPQKAAFYSEVLDSTVKYLDALPEYHYPYMEGGKIYTTAQEAFNNKLPFHAFDGKRWDSSVGKILRKAFRPWMINIAGLDMLPTGTSVTSILDTMANIVATRHLRGKLIALGDDMNYFGPDASKLNVPYIELQPEDSLHKYILGVCFEPDINAPRISGIKCTMDRAGQMKPLPAQFETEGSALITRKRDVRSRVAWAGLFKGQFGEGTLLEAIQKMPASSHLAPTEYIEDLIESRTDEVDVFAWAERAGIKTIFS